MRYVLTVILAGILSAGIAFSADYTPFEPPEVTPEMFEGDKFEDDPEAKAFYFYRTATSMLEHKYSNIHKVFSYKSRIRILDEELLENYEDISLSFITARGYNEEYQDISVKIHNLKGSKVKTTEIKEKNFEETSTEIPDNDQGAKRNTITIPLEDVQVGSIIDFEYTKITPGVHPNSWRYQNQYPVLYSEYIYETLDIIDYARVEKGDQFIDVDEEYEGGGVRDGQGALQPTKIFFTSIPDLPAFNAFNSIDAVDDWITNISFVVKGANQNGYQSNLRSFDKQIADYFEDKEGTISNFMSDAEFDAPNIVMDLGLDNMYSAQEKISAIYRYILDNYECTGGAGPIPDKTWSELMNKKEGDRATINHMYMALLKETGYEVTPMCTYNRRSGELDKSLANPLSLPYFILYVQAEGMEYYLDASEKYLKWNELNYNLCDHQGLLFIEGTQEWKTPKASERSNSSIEIATILDFDADTMKANIKMSGTGYDAYRYRVQYEQLEELDSLHLFKEGFEEGVFEEGIEGDLTFSGMDSRLGTAQMEFTAKYTIEKDGKTYLVNPFLNVGDKLVRNFEAPTRYYPIQFPYLNTSKYEINITIPAGYKFEEIPADMEAQKDDGTIILSYKTKKKSDTELTVMVTTEYKQRTYPYKQYEEIKSVHDKLLETVNAPIRVSK